MKQCRIPCNPKTDKNVTINVEIVATLTFVSAKKSFNGIINDRTVKVETDSAPLEWILHNPQCHKARHIPYLQTRHRPNNENSHVSQPVEVVRPLEAYKTTIAWSVHSHGHHDKEKPLRQCHRRWCKSYPCMCLPQKNIQFGPVDSEWQDKLAYVLTSSSLSAHIFHNKLGLVQKVARTQRPERGSRILGDGNGSGTRMSMHIWGRKFGHYLETHQDATLHHTNDGTFIAKTLKPGGWATEAHIALSASWLATSFYGWHSQCQQ